MAQQYAIPSSGASKGDPRGLSGFIRETAQKYGIDPEVALRVARSEGLSSFRSGVRTKGGGEEPSFGAFQLYTGGGLGNQFQKETGLDPSDPANEKATIDYALKTAAKTGWGPWHGAKNTGIGQWEGIDPAKTAATSAGQTPVSEGGAVVSDAPKTATEGAPATFMDKLKNTQGGASQGLGEAVSGLGAALTGTSPRGADMYATSAARSTPVPMTPSPPPIIPTVNPQAADMQRQQLAAAMQRLNSGKLY